jgi:hypothetical protein
MARSDDVTTSKVRRGYRRPELHQYGAMRDVTRGGSAGSPEGGSQSRQKAMS